MELVMGTVNLILVIVIFSLLMIYLGIKIYFTVTYQNYDLPLINSANDVISNQDLDEIVHYYQKVFHLEDYHLNYEVTENFITLGSAVKRRKKTLNFSKELFGSVGYELDYLIGTMWFVSQLANRKNHRVRFYDFTNRFGFMINFLLLLLTFLATLIIYLIGTITYDGEITNVTLNFFWTFPLFQMLSFFLFLNFFIIFYILVVLKGKLEKQYTETLNATFNQAFKPYAFDLKAARAYSMGVPTPHNLAFKTTNTKFKWLGPFVRN